MESVLLSLLVLLSIVNYGSSQNCVGRVDGIEYDLTSLQNNDTDYRITNVEVANPYYIRLNLCRPLVDLGVPACKQGASGCQYWDVPNPTHEATLGLASTMEVTPIYSTQNTSYAIGLKAFFSGGISFNGRPLNYSIHLMCNQSAGVGYPTVHSQGFGYFNFMWYTQYACVQQNPCIGHTDGMYYDLTPLQNNTQDYEITQSESNTTYLIRLNFCRPLINRSNGSLTCFAGAFGCMFLDEYENVTLGLVSTMGVSTIEGGLSIVFTGGQQSWNHGSAYSVISLLCNKNSGIGSPTFSGYTMEGSYMFTWESSVGCIAKRKSNAITISE